MVTITVNIDGKTYRMACEEGQEQYLSGLAEQFDRQVVELRSSFGEIGDLRLTVMAGITLIDQLTELRNKVLTLETEIKAIKTNRNQGVHDHLTEMVSRVDQLAKKIAQHLN